MPETLEGQQAPDFSLQGSDGQTHTPADYRGKFLVLFFYPKDNTPGCTKEACGFRDGYAELQAAGATLLGVSRDSLVSHEKFITQYTLPFVLLSDPDHSMMEAYGAWGVKNMYGKETEGTLRSTVVVGPDGTVVKHWPRVKDAEAHPGEVLEFLQSLA